MTPQESTARPYAAPAVKSSSFATFALCIMASLADGFDMQTTGITAMKYRAEFALSTDQLSWIFASNSAGLLVGATLGGWLADRIGRRWIMIASMLVFGVFSLVTGMLPNGDLFAGVRFLTGLGLGAAVANIIALVAEAGAAGSQATRVTVLTASNPLGGAIAAGLVSLYPDINWRDVFFIGGWWPLAIAALMIPWLPESAAFKKRRDCWETGDKTANPVSMRTALFAEGRALPTLMLWVAFFFCVLAIHLVINWLPSLLVGQGYTPREAAIAACAFPFGGAVGTALLGLMMGSMPRHRVMAVAFGGIVVSVAGLALAPHSFPIMMTAALLSGFFVIGAQFLLYGLSPTYYPSRARGTGVGVAVAVGRVGSIAGPVMAGLLLGAGRPAGQVLISILPGVILAFMAALVLSNAPAASDE